VTVVQGVPELRPGVYSWTSRGRSPYGPESAGRPPPAITAVASVGAVCPPAVSAQPLGPPPLPPPSPPPVYSTIQQPADALASGRWAEQPSVDVMARQTAAGFREAGLLLNGLAGGGAEGIDLNPSARRVLHAQQMLLGTRAAGPLGSLRLRRANCRRNRRTCRRSWANRPLRLRTRAPHSTLGFRALRTACSNPRPIAPRSARNSCQEGRPAAVGLLRCSQHCAESLFIPYSPGVLGSFRLTGACRSRRICCASSAARFSCTTPLKARLASLESAGNRRPVGRWTSWAQSSRTLPRGTGQTSPTRRGPNNATSWAG
jgi:hypothetical protein